MQTLNDWRTAKQLQTAYEEFRNSDAGEAMYQTLISQMMDGVPDVTVGAEPIQVEAMSSAFMKGYRQCLRNLESLRPKYFMAPELVKKEVSPSGFPVDQAKLEKIKANIPTQ